MFLKAPDDDQVKVKYAEDSFMISGSRRRDHPSILKRQRNCNIRVASLLVSFVPWEERIKSTHAPLNTLS